MSFSSCASRKGYRVQLLDTAPLPLAAAPSPLLRVVFMTVHTSLEAKSENELKVAYSAV